MFCIYCKINVQTKNEKTIWVNLKKISVNPADLTVKLPYLNY